MPCAECKRLSATYNELIQFYRQALNSVTHYASPGANAIEWASHLHIKCLEASDKFLQHVTLKHS